MSTAAERSGRTARPEEAVIPGLEVSLWERLLSPENLGRALRRVRANGGAPGADGMTTEEFVPWLREHWASVREALDAGTYRPSPVRRVVIPKPGAASVCWGCPRRRHSAALSSDPLGFVIVTHPFHPLNGQRLEILYAKRRGAGMVFVCAGGFSGQMTLPESWTDRGEPAGPGRLSAEGLAALGAATRALQGR